MIGYHQRKPRRGSSRNEARIPREDIAFAMELREEGVSWRWIGFALGYTAGQIKGSVRRAVS